MSRTSVALAVLAAAALVHALVSEHSLQSRLEQSERALEAARGREGALAESLRGLEQRTPEVRRSPAADRGEAGSAHARPDPGTRLDPPEDSGLGEPGADQNREARVRALLDQRIRGAFSGGEIDDRTRTRMLDQLLRIRALRPHTATAGTAGSASDASRDELYQAQLAFTDLAGMEVGEFLETIQTRDPPRAVRPWELPPMPAAEVRKRFADETAVRLGITQPGSTEVLAIGSCVPR